VGKSATVTAIVWQHGLPGFVGPFSTPWVKGFAGKSWSRRERGHCCTYTTEGSFFRVASQITRKMTSTGSHAKRFSAIPIIDPVPIKPHRAT
jgi:hypothetical protein